MKCADCGKDTESKELYWNPKTNKDEPLCDKCLDKRTEEQQELCAKNDWAMLHKEGKQSKTFRDVGKENSLEDLTLERYCEYMTTRWSLEEEVMCKTNYAQEWADRFRLGNEYDSSDLVGQAILTDMDAQKRR